MKKVALWPVFVLMILGCASSALAFNQDWGGYEDDWSMPTGTEFSGPKATRCTASALEKQRCRDCREQLDDNGQPTGKIVCAYVAENASCGCDWIRRLDGRLECSPYGTCTYSVGGN